MRGRWWKARVSLLAFVPEVQPASTMTRHAAQRKAGLFLRSLASCGPVPGCKK